MHLAYLSDAVIGEGQYRADVTATTTASAKQTARIGGDAFIGSDRSDRADPSASACRARSAAARRPVLWRVREAVNYPGAGEAKSDSASGIISHGLSSLLIKWAVAPCLRVVRRHGVDRGPSTCAGRGGLSISSRSSTRIRLQALRRRPHALGHTGVPEENAHPHRDFTGESSSSPASSKTTWISSESCRSRATPS